MSRCWEALTGAVREHRSQIDIMIVDYLRLVIESASKLRDMRTARPLSVLLIRSRMCACSIHISSSPLPSMSWARNGCRKSTMRIPKTSRRKARPTNINRTCHNRWHRFPGSQTKCSNSRAHKRLQRPVHEEHDSMYLVQTSLLTHIHISTAVGILVKSFASYDQCLRFLAPRRQFFSCLRRIRGRRRFRRGFPPLGPQYPRPPRSTSDIPGQSRVPQPICLWCTPQNSPCSLPQDKRVLVLGRSMFAHRRSVCMSPRKRPCDTWRDGCVVRQSRPARERSTIDDVIEGPEPGWRCDCIEGIGVRVQEHRGRGLVIRN